MPNSVFTDDARDCRRTAILALLSLVLTLQYTKSWHTISIGATAFSATANNLAKNKNYDSSSIREAREKFDAWNSADPNTNTIREYVVREEDIDQEDNCNVRNYRISHFATRIFSESLPSPNAANLACRAGSLTLNSTKVSGGRILRAGDVIAYNSSIAGGDRRTMVPSVPLRAERFCASRLRLLQTLSDESLSHTPLRVLYEDHCMAIVCKPAGIHTMSWSGSLGKSLCLDEILPLLLTPPGASAGNFEDEGLPAPLPRHRLDHRVAGPVVVAKTRRASVEIGRSFEEKTVTKEYRAIVVGDIDMNAIEELDEVSNVDRSTRSFTICSDVDDKQSQTEAQVLGSTPCNINGVLTDLKLFPKTGRKHQLRIHCARVLRTPILGDDLYWDENLSSGGISVRKRQGLYLYCKKITINHPLLRSNKEDVPAEIEEPLRYTRTRKKARKGFEWSRNNAEISKKD
eukprot:CAMPEP_0116148650 /NCGR_PEP_ID=MMETSP0329-20121206/18489_1 /TAXON_ID=697910 /ORGANISM="Pseudo-nitzschia arenysensis, Strain B593" /LENGTH=459 /DNA_ID=CAMNT_0003644835 /DNA_START=111 /DNA_END=1490 /DNA_ORIENTATION=-